MAIRILLKLPRHHARDLIEPSIFLAVFPYAFIAAFPTFGIILVTKWELDRRKNKKHLLDKNKKIGDAAAR